MSFAARHDLKSHQMGAPLHLSGDMQGAAAGGLLPAIFLALADAHDSTWDAACSWAEEILLRRSGNRSR